MSSIPGQIVSELGEVAKQTGTEAAKISADVVGAAIESLVGSATQKAPKTAVVAHTEASTASHEPTALEQFSQTHDEAVKKSIARAALEQLATVKEKPEEPTVQERLEREEHQKQEAAKRRAAVAAQMAPVSAPKGKQRADPWGLKGKQSSEVSRNVR